MLEISRVLKYESWHILYTPFELLEEQFVIHEKRAFSLLKTRWVSG